MTLGCKEARSNKPVPRRRVRVLDRQPGLSSTEILVAFFHSLAVATCVLVLAAVKDWRAFGLLAGAVALVGFFVLKLKIVARGDSRIRLSLADRMLLSLCALWVLLAGGGSLISLIDRIGRRY